MNHLIQEIMAARATFQKSFNIKVNHDEAQGTFSIKTMEGALILHYQQGEEGVWDFDQMTIPAELRNFQLTPRLVEYALETARKAGQSIRANCPQVQSYLERNEFYKSLLAQA